MECNDTEKLTWEEVKEHAEDIVTIKGHDIALCDCGRFGYCALVFKNQLHLYYIMPISSMVIVDTIERLIPIS